jgi:hypothetical protein
VREAAYKGFGSLVGKVGERPLSPWLSKLDGIKAKKVKENYPEKIFTGNLNASEQSKPKPKPKPTALAKPAPKPAPKKPQQSDDKRRNAVAPPNAAKPLAGPVAAGAKPPAKAPEPTTNPTSAGKNLSRASVPPVIPTPPLPLVEPPLPSPEEGTARAKELLPEEALQLLDASTPAERAAGLCFLLPVSHRLCRHGTIMCRNRRADKR